MTTGGHKDEVKKDGVIAAGLARRREGQASACPRTSGRSSRRSKTKKNEGLTNPRLQVWHGHLARVSWAGRPCHEVLQDLETSAQSRMETGSRKTRCGGQGRPRPALCSPFHQKRMIFRPLSLTDYRPLTPTTVSLWYHHENDETELVTSQASSHVTHRANSERSRTGLDH